MDAASATPSKHPWDLYTNPERRWFLFLLFLVSLSSQLDLAVTAVLVEPIKKEFHATDAMMGGLTGFAFAACYAIVALPAARFSDRGDRRWVISLSIAVWSVMTVVSGFARSFWALAAARVGVGEAGAGPASGSLIGDYYAPNRRAGAIAAGLISNAVGGGLAAILGASIAEKYGWRSAFIAMGAPGLLLALLSFFGLSEPRRKIGAGPAAVEDASMLTTLRQLAAKPTFILLVVSLTLYTAMARGLGAWAPAYTMRTLGLSLTKMGATIGLATTFATLVGTIGGGLFSDAPASRDKRWLFWIPGLIMLGSTPFWVYCFWTTNFSIFVWILVGANVVLTATFPALLSGLQLIVHSRQRATSIAVVGFFTSLVGSGLGPLLTGAISDALTPMVGAQSLRYAMMATVLTLIPCGAATLACARSVSGDLEDGF